MQVEEETSPRLVLEPHVNEIRLREVECETRIIASALAVPSRTASGRGGLLGRGPLARRWRRHVRIVAERPGVHQRDYHHQGSDHGRYRQHDDRAASSLSAATGEKSRVIVREAEGALADVATGSPSPAIAPSHGAVC
jgi:hypothetical protein